jgi:hypothetical protein
MQADPIGHSGRINLYAYVGGDPVNYTDPWGRICVDVTGAKRRQCVEVDGDGDGDTSDDDVPREIESRVERAFLAFIRANGGRDISSFIKEVSGGDEESETFLRVISQFVGAAMTDAGGVGLVRGKEWCGLRSSHLWVVLMP